MMAMEMGSATKGWRSPSGRGSFSFFILRLLEGCVAWFLEGSSAVVRSSNDSMGACIADMMISDNYC